MQKKKCKGKDHGQASCDNAPTRLANKLKKWCLLKHLKYFLQQHLQYNALPAVDNGGFPI